MSVDAMMAQISAALEAAVAPPLMAHGFADAVIGVDPDVHCRVRWGREGVSPGEAALNEWLPFVWESAMAADPRPEIAWRSVEVAPPVPVIPWAFIERFAVGAAL